MIIETPTGQDYSGAGDPGEEQDYDNSYEEQEEDSDQDGEEEDPEEDSDDYSDEDSEEESEEDDSETLDDEEEEDEDDEDFDEEPVVSANRKLLADLNEKFFGGSLKLDQLPEDLSAEDSQQVVVELIENIQNTANSQLAQYQQINQLLQDKEVVEFLQYRQQGKSLKELVSKYAAPMNDDALAASVLQERNPGWDDDTIQDMIEVMKKRGTYESMVEQEKQRINALEQTQIQKENHRIQREREQQEQRVQQSIQQFNSFLEQTPEYNGIPLDTQKKGQIGQLATAVNPNTGNPLLQDLLERDEFLLKACFGILYGDQYIQKGISTDKKAKKQFLDLINNVDDTPGVARKKGGKRRTNVDYEAANRF